MTNAANPVENGMSATDCECDVAASVASPEPLATDSASGPTIGLPAKRSKRYGAPKGNRNRLIHGIRANLVAGRLPDGAQWVGRATNELRRQIEYAVEANGAALDLPTLACIQTAIRWERHALLCTRWLREPNGKLSHEQRLAYSREIARASAERDRALRELGLKPGGKRSVNIREILYEARDVGTPENGHASTENAQSRASGDAEAPSQSEAADGPTATEAKPEAQEGDV